MFAEPLVDIEKKVGSILYILFAKYATYFKDKNIYYNNHF